jgi:hypothetical protein
MTLAVLPATVPSTSPRVRDRLRHHIGELARIARQTKYDRRAAARANDFVALAGYEARLERLKTLLTLLCTAAAHRRYRRHRPALHADRAAQLVWLKTEAEQLDQNRRWGWSGPLADHWAHARLAVLAVIEDESALA